MMSSKLKHMIKAFENDGILSDGSIIRCNLCNTVIKVDRKHQQQQVKRHVDSAKHKVKQGSKANRPEQSFITSSFKTQEEKSISQKAFNTALTAAFIRSGIPLHKINEPHMKSFLETFTNFSIPDESTLRKNYVKPLYDDTIAKIQSEVESHPVAFIVDESTDFLNRFAVNVLVSPLKDKATRPMLLKVSYIEKNNNTNIMQVFNDACSMLWPAGIRYNQVWLFLTDQASYMLTAGEKLKDLYPNMKHVTCIVHSLHRVCEHIREKFPLVNDFVSNLKKILSKSPSRILLYRNITGLPLPPTPVVTRWGTWLETSIFLCENFEKISIFIEELSTETQAISKIKDIVKQNELQDELYAVASYKFLIPAMSRLQSSDLEKLNQWEILEEVKGKLKGFALNKLESNMQRNPDIYEFVHNRNLNHRLITRYAPLNTASVERSFSKMKDILSPKRSRLTTDNIEMLNIIDFNKFLF